MPANNEERRKELRVTQPAQCRFNILGPTDDFIRTNPAMQAARAAVDTHTRLEGRDDLERFMIRLDDKLDTIIALLMDRIARKEYEYKAVVLDLSESGMRIISPVALPIGTRLELGMVLPHQPHRTLEIGAETIWDRDSATDTKGKKTVGLHFTDILESDQDEIVHWIFQKQREEIRRSRDLE